MANDLSIKVKVDLDSGDIKNIRTRFKEAFGKEGLKIKPEIDVSGMDKALKEVGKFKRELNSIQKNNKPIKIDVQADTSQVTSGVNKASAKIKKEFEDISKKTGSVGEQTKKLKADFKELEKVHINLVKADDERKIKGLKTRMDELNASISKTKAELASIKVPGVNTKNWTSNVEGYVNKLRRDMIDNVNRKGRTAAVDNQYKRQVADEKNAARELEAIHRQNARIQKEGYQEIANSMREEYRLQKDILSAGEAETRVLNSQLEKTRARTSALREQYQLTQQQENKLSQLESKQSAHLAQSAARKADVENDRRSKKSHGGFSATMDIYNTAQDGAMAVAGAISALSEVDSKIAAVTRVANGSKKEMEEFSKSIYDNAAKVGKTAPEYASAVEQWATAGFNLKNSVKLAKDSLIGSVVGDVDVNDMVNYMSIPLKAFEKEGLNSKDIINSMNEVSNENAIEMNDLGSAYSKASTQIASTNTSFSELTGMITGAQEATRAGGDVIGRSIKAISLNFANMGNNLTKANAARHDWFSSIGVQLTDSNGKLKSTYDIMDQLASKWNDLSENDQNTAAYYAAGKEHAAQFVGMLQQWKTVKKAEKEARDQVNLTDKENGSAFQEFAKQSDTIEFHLKQMQDAWMKLLSDLTGGRDGINKLIDTAKSFAEVLDKLVVGITNSDNAMSALKIAGTMVLFGALKKMIAGTTEGLVNFGKSYKENVTDNIKNFRESVAAIKNKQSLSEYRKNQNKEEKSYDVAYERVAPKPSSRKKKGGQTRRFKKVITTEFQTKGAGKTARELENNTKKVRIFSKGLRGIKAAGSVAMGAISMLSAGLGVFGVVIDVIMLALAGLELAGIDPIKSLDRAFHPAKAHAEDVAKAISDITKESEKLEKSLDKNVILNGKVKKNDKTVADLNESFEKAKPEDGSNELEESDFNAIKKKYNKLAKDNGLKLRIEFNNADLIKDQLEAINGQVAALKRQDAGKALDGLVDEAKQLGELSKNSSLESLNGDYASKKKALEEEYEISKKDHDNGIFTGEAWDKYEKQYKKEVDELNSTYETGTKLAEAWSSKNGKAITKAWNTQTKAIRDHVKSITSALNSDTFSTEDIKSMDSDQLNQLQLAQGTVLHNYKQQESIIDSINKKRESGEELNTAELKFLASQSEGLQGVAKDTNSWSESQVQAYDQLTSKMNENKEAAVNRMKTILEANGILGKDQEDLIAAYQKSNSEYIKLMAEQGDVGKALLNVSAEFAGKYGKDWGDALASIQEKVDKIPKEAMTKYSFVDETTGLIDTNVIDKLNEIPKDKMTEYGIKYDKYGGVDVDSIIKGLDGIPKEKLTKMGVIKADGSVDPVSFMDQIVNHADKVPKEIMLHFLANTQGFSEKTQEVLKQAMKVDGVKGVAQYIADTKMFGEETDKVLAFVRSFDGTTVDARITATAEGFTTAMSNAKNSLAELNNDPQLSLKIKGDPTGVTNSVSAALTSLQTIHDKEVNITGDKSQLDAEKNAALAELETLRDKLVKIYGDNSPVIQAIDTTLQSYGLLPEEKVTKLKAEGDPNGAQKAGADDKNAYSNGFNANGLPKLPTDNLFTNTNKTAADNGTKDGQTYVDNFNSALSKMNTNPSSSSSNSNSDSSSKSSGGGWWDTVKESLLGGGISSGLVKEYSDNHKSGGSSSKSNTEQKPIEVEITAKDSTAKGVEQARNSIQALNKDKNSRISIAAKDSTAKGVEAARTSIQKLNSNKNSRISIAAKDSTAKGVRAARKSIQSLNKAKNSRIKITAQNKVGRTISSVKHSLTGLKKSNVKVTINARNNVSKAVNRARSSIKSLRNKTVTISARNRVNSQVSRARSSISRLRGKTVTLKANNRIPSEVRRAKRALGSLHTKEVTVRLKDKISPEIKNIQGRIDSLHGKSVTITTNSVENKTVVTHKKSKSLAIPTSEIANPNMLRSMSIVADSKDLSRHVKQQAKSLAVRDKSESTQNDARVDESYWRYMGHELYTGKPLDSQMSSLENSVTKASDDLNKLISLSRQRIDLDNRQIAYQKTMQGAYQDQMNDLLNKLRQKGFATNGNQITNLGHARDFVGDDASKVNELLSSYRSVYENLTSINDKIDSLNTDIYNQQKNIKDRETELESKKIEELQRQLELLTTAISNNKSILNRKSESLSSNDYYLRLNVDAEQVNASSDAINQLVGQFNKLSVMTFSAPEQAKKIQESLNSIKTSILENADAVIKLRTEMKDAEIAAITSDLETFTNNLNTDIDRLKNNITNIQDGLLSGTSFGDLLSSEFDVSDFSRKSVYEQQIQDRLSLERQLDDALDAFAKRNVDRTAQVANQQLQIEQSKYSELIRLTKEYSNGYVAPINTISAVYPSNEDGAGRQQALNIAGSKGEEYMKASVEYSREMAELKERYQQALDKAVNSQDKERINSKYIVEQMDLQRKIYESMIAADKESIETLTNKYHNENLSSDQLAKINESIANYKSNIMSAQNSIKEAVKARFDYENKMITEQMDKYKSLTDTLTNLVSISKALNLNSDVKGRLLDQQYASSYREYNNYLGVVSTLRNQQSQYDRGSYEWNLLDKQIDTFEKSISSSVNSLLDITKAQFENKLAGVQEEIEKSVNGGMTSSEAKFQDDTWYTGVQKELQLETMRQKTIDLENDVIKRRLEALDAQKEMSKAEADYVSKQIDLAVAEQKLNNVMGQKNVQVLEKGSDGKFNWDYVAKKEDVDAAKEAVNKARGELETARKQDRNDYITKVEQVISGAKDGSLKPEDVKSRLQQLNDSYKFILEDIPNFNVDNIEKIIEAYDDYVTKNKAVIKDYGQDSEIAPMTGYKDIVKDFNDEFKLVSKELGDIFGKELRDVLYQQSNNALRDDVRGDSLTIENMTLELPNVQDIDDFQRALKTLPDVAKQHAQGK